MPMRMLPRTFAAMRMAVIIRPSIARKTGGETRLPKATVVAGLAVMIPPLMKPIRAINKPIPAATAFFKELGIALSIQSTIPVTAKMKKTIPEMTTAPKAACQDAPRPRTTVKAKKALRPMPLARAKG